MKDGSLDNKEEMGYLSCDLPFSSSKELEEVAELVSAKVFGGIPFVGRATHIYDEVPAVYTQYDVFGLKIVLQGSPGEEGYHLGFHPMRFPNDQSSEVSVRPVHIDISNYISFLLKDIPEIELE